MTHTYRVTGMTCMSCEAKVKSSLLMIPGVTEAAVSKDAQTAAVSMEKHIPLNALQASLDKKYAISSPANEEAAVRSKSWLSTYKPILIIFSYATVLSLLIATDKGRVNWMQAMNIFMAAFFISFSFFKMLDLKGFAESYAMYDIIAKKIPAWGYVYAFAELALGLAYATGFQPLLTNAITLALMTVSIIGVLKSVLNKTKIKCACLGSVFNLPMSTVTIIEDALMIVMSAGMLVMVS